MLDIRNIVKQYAAHRALDDVSLQVARGSIFGLLGPNGAGKTSLIRIINQITAPDSGEIRFNGERLNPSHISRIGYLPEERGLYKKMEIGEQMLYLAQLKGLSKKEATDRIRHWFEKMEMQTWWNKKIEDLSKGMQQKVQFVATVVHQPDLIILDEPFTGFDPVNVDIIKEEILSLNRNGATIIFSTHRMESVEELCDSIVLINKAKKILEGRVIDIKNAHKTNHFHIEYQVGTSGSGPITAVEGLFEVLESSPQNFRDRQNFQHPQNSPDLQEHNYRSTIRVEEGRTINEVLTHLIPLVGIQELRELIPSIHDIFIREVTQQKPH